MSKDRHKPVLLDTSVLIEYMRQQVAISEQVEWLIDHRSIALSAITASEILLGSAEKEFNSIKRFISDHRFYHLSDGVSAWFWELINEYRGLSPRWIPDALIAATALYHGLELYTLNTRDFSFIRGLRLYKPRSLRT